MIFIFFKPVASLVQALALTESTSNDYFLTVEHMPNKAMQNEVIT